MFRTFIKFWFGLTGVIILLTFVPLALPYDHSRTEQARTWLTDMDCPLPCFMGIAPGFMDYREAVMLLEENAWVASVDETRLIHYDDGGSGDFASGEIRWEWSGFQPLWINTFSFGKLAVEDNFVIRIEIQTTLTYGEFSLMLGQPEWGVIRTSQRVAGVPQANHYALYPNRRLWVQSLSECPLSLLRIWGAPVLMGIGDDPPIQMGVYDLGGWLRNPPACDY